MVKVIGIYSKSIKSSVGPSKTLTRYNQNISMFKENGVEFNLISKDTIGLSINNRSQSNIKKRLIGGIKNILIIFSKYSAFVSWKLVVNQHIRHSIAIIDYYLKKNEQPDILVFHELFTCYYYLIKNPQNKSQIVLFQHNNGEINSMLLNMYPKLKRSPYSEKLNEIRDTVLQKLDKIVFISKNACDKFKDMYNFNNSKIDYILNGVEDLNADDKIEVLQKMNNRGYDCYNFICSGSLNCRKSQINLIYALARVESRIREKISITLLGNGPDFNLIKQVAKKLKIDKHLVLEGTVNNVHSFLMRSNIYVQPSIDEGLPISIIEAMRVGLPIVGTNVAGIPEQIDHNVNGLLIDIGVNPLIEMFNNLENYNWKSMGIESRRKYERSFTLHRNISEYCRVIEETAKQN